MDVVALLVLAFAGLIAVLEFMLIRAERKRRADLAHVRDGLDELTVRVGSLGMTDQLQGLADNTDRQLQVIRAEFEARFAKDTQGTAEKLDELRTELDGLRTELPGLRTELDRQDISVKSSMGAFSHDVSGLRQSLERLETAREDVLSELRDTTATHRESLDGLEQEAAEAAARLDERHLALVRALEAVEAELMAVRAAVIADFEFSSAGTAHFGRISTGDDAARVVLTDLYESLAEAHGLRIGYDPPSDDACYLFGSAFDDLARTLDGQLRTERFSPELAALLIAAFHTQDAFIQLGPLVIEKSGGRLRCGTEQARGPAAALPAEIVDLTEWAQRQRG